MAVRAVIEWTRTSLRLAIADGTGQKAKLQTLRSQAISASGEVSESLEALLKTVKLANAHVIVIIPREQVITRVVKFPSVHLPEVRQMAELYAKGQLPYPREQTVMDLHILQQQDGFTTVAIVACLREAVDRYLAVLEDAGVKADLVTLSTWGVLGWYRASAAAQPADEPVLIVNVDESRTDLVLVAQGAILGSRSIGQGAVDWTSALDTPELLAREAERSRAAARKELPGSEVRSVILTGQGPLAEWAKPIGQQLALPVEVRDARQAFRAAGVTVPEAISPVVVGGVALSDPEQVLNLSPADVTHQTLHRRQLRELTLVAGLIVGVLVCGGALLRVQVSRQHAQTMELEQALAEAEPTAKAVRERMRVTERIHGLLAARQRTAGLLAGVFQHSLPGVTLEAMTFDQARRELVLRGSAHTTQDVLAYIKELNALDAVGDVQLKYSTRRTGPSGERTDFEISIRQEEPRA